LSKIFSDEIKNVPYPLPEGWRWVRLGEIAEIKSGGTPSRKIKKYWENGTIPWIGSSVCKNDIVDKSFIKEKITEEGLKNSSAKIFPKNSVLIALVGATLGKIGFLTFDSTTNQNIAGIYNFQGTIYHKYLFYSLISLKLYTYFKNFGFKMMNLNFVKNILIPLPYKNNQPDLEKQKQIVEKIEAIFEKIDRAITLRQKALEDTKKLFESVLNKIFKEAEEDKENWKWIKLGEIGKVFAGSSAPQDKKYFRNGKYPFVRVSDLGKYGKTTNLTKVNDYINEDAIKEKRLVKAKMGTIIFPKSGAAILTNNKGILGLDAYVVSHLACIETKENYDNYFIFYMLYNLDFKSIVNNLSYPSLTSKEIKEITIPIPIKNNQPDIEKQKEIAQYLDNLHNKIKQLEELQKGQLEKFKQLKESILNKAFRGKLV